MRQQLSRHVEQPEDLELLADARRRELLRVLQETDTPVGLDDLTRELLVREQETSEPETDGEQFRRRRIALYHQHIPKLADAGVVEFDVDRQTVTLE